MTREVFSVPVNFQAQDGSWHKIDTGLESSQVPGFAVENGDNAFDVLLPQDAGSTPVRVESEDSWLTLRSVGADGAPDVTGSAAVYDGPVADSEVTYDITTTGVKETVTLAEPPAASGAPLSLAFRLGLSDGLVPQLRSDGSVMVRDGSGVARYRVPAPVMFDSADAGGAPALSTDIETTLVEVSGSWVLRVTPSAAWLTDPARVYPVMVDPTVTVRSNGSSIDCWIGEDVPTTPACSTADTYIWAGRLANGDRRRGLLYFDLDMIPSNATVSRATVKLYLYSSKTRTSLNNSYGLRRINSSYWNTSATWNKRSATASWTNPGGDYDASPAPALTSIAGNAASGDQTLAATSIVQSWFPGSGATPVANKGFVLRAFPETTDQAVAFASSGNSDTAKYPRIEVVYKTTAATILPQPANCQSPCQSPYVMNSANPTFIAQLPAAGTATPDDATFEVREKGTVPPYTDPYPTGTVPVDSTGKAQIQLPAVFNASKTYEIRAGALNSLGATTWGAWITFTVRLVPGAPSIVSMAPCVGPCSDWATNTATPTFGASATDADSQKLNYHFQVATSAGTTLKTWDLEGVDVNDVARGVVPVGAIGSSGYYQVRAGVDDGTLETPQPTTWGPWRPFSVAIAQPNPTTAPCANGANHITTPITWDRAHSPYLLIDCNVDIKAGGALTIEPGVVVKFADVVPFDGARVLSSRSILVRGGALRAEGTSSSPIVFAHLSDDRFGGDTDTTTTTPNYFFRGLSFEGGGSPGEGTVTPTSVLDNVAIMRGGRFQGSGNGRCDREDPAMRVERNARVVVRHSVFGEIDCAALGVGEGGIINVTDTAFEGNAETNLLSEVFSGSFIRNVFNAGTAYKTNVAGGAAQLRDLNFQDNVFLGGLLFNDSGLTVAEKIPTSMTFAGNSFTREPYGLSPQDYRNNWWGRAIEPHPNECWLDGQVPEWSKDGPVNSESCGKPGNMTPEVRGGYVNVVIPATSKPPAPLRAGLEASPISPVVDLEQLYGSGSEFGGRPTGEQADPVNSATGSYFEDVVDASVANIGYPLAFGRTYNSADSRVGLLGKGWTSNLEHQLSFPDSTHATFLAGDGQRLKFTKTGSTWVGGTGVTATLRSAGSGYEVLTRAQVVYAFDSNGRIQSVRDRNNQGVTYTWTGAQLTSATSSGRTLSFDYAAGRLTKVTLPDGRHADFAYSSDNERLVSATDLAGLSVAYGHDAAGRITTESVPSGAGNANPGAHTITMMRLAYDATTGRVSDQWDALDHHTTFAWDPVQQVSTMTAPDGGRWIDDYNGSTLFARLDPLGRTTFYDWDSQARLVQTTNPRGDVVAMKFDQSGDLVKSDTPAESITTTYNSRHDPIDAVTDTGVTTHVDYDTNGNATSVTTSDPTPATAPGSTLTTSTTTTSSTYYANGLLKDATDAAGKTTQYLFFNAAATTDITTPEGRRTHYGYDSVGRTTTVVDPRAYAQTSTPTTTVLASFTTTTVYNARDQVTSLTDPLGNTSTNTYNSLGQVITAADANQNATTYTYDDAGNTMKVVEPGTQTPTNEYTYDVNGNLKTVKDPDNRVVTYTYDKANQTRTETGPLGTSTYTYDVGGNIATATQPGRGTISYRWNDKHQPVLVNYPTSPDVNYRYDRQGRLKSMTDGAGVESWTWDNYDRPRTVARTIDSGTATTTYDFTVLGQLKTTTGPGGTRGYTYSDDGLLKTVAGSTTAALVTYTYDKAGNPTRAVNGDGSNSDRAYDNAGRLTSIKNRTQSGTTTLEDTYTLDAVGNPEAITHAAGAITATTPGTIDTYLYDDLNQLTDVCYSATNTTSCAGSTNRIHWDYTAAGNRTTEARTVGTTTTTTTSTYDATTGRLATTNTGGVSTNYTYDAASRLTSDGTSTYTYTDNDRLATQTTAGITTTYTYDGNGRRLRASAGATNPTLTNYWWDPLTYQLSAETNTGLVRAYINGLGPVGYTTSANATPTNGYWFHQDLQGSTRAVTNTTGAVSATASYEPYGVVRDAQQIITTDPKSPIGWAGQYTDPDATSHLRARQYNPKLGAFTVPDPAKSTTASATYTYANNNPLTNSDPSGLSPLDVLGSGFSAIGRGFNQVFVQPFVNAYNSVRNAFDVCTGNTKGSCAGAIGGAAINLLIAAFTIGSISLGGLLVKSAAKQIAGGAARRITARAVGSTGDDALRGARAARDAKAAEVGASKATVTGGYGRNRVPVAGCNRNPVGCAEDDVARQIGGNPKDITFTEAIRPRTGEQVPICPRCQGTYDQSQFPPGTLWDRKGPWSRQ